MRFVLFLLLVLWFSQVFCQDSTKVEKRNLPYNQGIINSTFLKNGLKTVLIQKQEVLTTKNKLIEQQGKGRHDPCVVPRAVPIVEAMAAIVIADFYLLNKIHQTK